DDGTFSLSVALQEKIEIPDMDLSKSPIYLTQKPQILDIPTYEGSGKAVHPSVHAFRIPWNGYRFWMAFTPYPNTQHENPSIVASGDGVNWVVPSGLTNPID